MAGTNISQGKRCRLPCLSITSMLKNLLESLEREIPKYVAAEKELTPAEEFVAQFEVMKVQLGRAMQTCEEKKDIVANYDAKIAELEAELARAKGKRAGAMANLKTAVDEMEPLKQSFTDSSSKSESFYVKQATLTAQKGVPAGIWVVIQDVLQILVTFSSVNSHSWLESSDVHKRK